MTDTPSDRTLLSHLNIGMLKALDHLLRERSVSGAARALGVSQPSMSNALARLRAALGDPLLVRSGSSMVLTPHGLGIAERVSVIVADLDALEWQQSFDPKTATTQFRIAVTDHSATIIIPHVVALMRVEAPGVRLVTVPVDGTFRDFGATDRDKVHLWMHWIKNAPPEWYTRKLLNETMVVIGRIGHPDLQQPLSLDRFLELDQVASSPSRSSFQTRADYELGKLGHKRRVVVTLAHFTSLPAVVQGTDLIALFPKRLIEALNLGGVVEVVESPIAFDNFSTSLAWHPRYQDDEGHKWLRELIGRATARL